MSVVDQLRETGTLSPDGALLLYEIVRDVALSRRFPPPAGFGSWTQNAVTTAAHEFLVGSNALRRLATLAIQADDDESFERLLRTSVLNFLRSEARRTVVGRQIRRVRDVVESSEEFVILDSEHVARVGGSVTPYTGLDDPLVRAAYRIKPTVSRWRPDSRRNGPVADRQEMEQLLREVLGTADGAVSLSQIARVISARFGLNALPAAVDVDALDPRPQREFENVDNSDQAVALLDQLSEREKKLLPILDLTAREVAQRLGVGRSTAARAQQDLRTRLSVALSASKDPSAVLRAVQEHLNSMPENHEP